MGKRITHLGPSGAGQLGKATNQIVVANTLVAVSEGMAFAAKSGLPLEPLHAALMGGAASSWMLDVLGKKMIARDFAPAFAIKHQQKDLAIVLATARENGVPLPGTALAHQLLSALEAQGRGEDGTQALLTLYERMAAAGRGSMSSPLSGVRALLLDLEGTVFQAGALIPGAARGARGRRSGAASRGASSPTPPAARAATLVSELAAMGLDVPAERLFTGPRAARALLLARGWTRCHFLLRPALLEDFDGIEPVESRRRRRRPRRSRQTT